MDETGLSANAANHVPLVPADFLERAGATWPEKTAVIHGSLRLSYRDFRDRARRMASALMRRGIGKGDVVSIIAPNTPAMLEAHYGVIMAGAVLNALNYRLDPATIAFILEHCGARLVLVDREFSALTQDALARMDTPPAVVGIDDELAASGELIGEVDYETFLAEGDPDPDWPRPADEWESMAVNYTSGTTGNPKGVVFNHRGAFLNAMGNAIAFGLDSHARYLWTLPMFHCNGWTFTWGVTAVGGTHVCLRAVDPALIFRLIAEHRVSHMCGAPIVLNLLIHAPAEARRQFTHRVEIATGGAAPPSAVIAGMERMGFQVTHLYGLTETYGPSGICAWPPEWEGLELDEKATRMARQGVGYPTLEGFRGGRSRDWLRRARRRRDHGRDLDARQHGDEGVPPQPRPPPPRRLPTAGFTVVISRSCTRTATPRSRTGPRTSSSRAARTFPRSRSRKRSTATRRSWRRRSLPSRTRSGAKHPVRSSPAHPVMKGLPRRT